MEGGRDLKVAIFASSCSSYTCTSHSFKQRLVKLLFWLIGKSNSIFNKPTQSFNCNETGMWLNPSSFKIVDEVGSKNLMYLTGSSKAQITVLACTCAAAYALLPLVILTKKVLTQNKPKEKFQQLPMDCLPMAGWIELNVFTGYLPQTLEARPLLLLLDGHTSHFCPDMIWMTAMEKVIIFALSPNITHLTQPTEHALLHWRLKKLCKS